MLKAAIITALLSVTVPAWACQSTHIPVFPTERGYGPKGDYVQAMQFSMIFGSPVVNLGAGEVFQMRHISGGCRIAGYAMIANCDEAKAFVVLGNKRSVAGGRTYEEPPILDQVWDLRNLFRNLPAALLNADADSVENILQLAPKGDIAVTPLPDIEESKKRRFAIQFDELSMLCNIHYPDSAGAKS